MNMRFTRKQVVGMMEEAGLGASEISDSATFRCVVGFRKSF